MALRDQLLGTEGLGCLVGRGAGGRQEASGAESPQTASPWGRRMQWGWKGDCILVKVSMMVYAHKTVKQD